MTRGTQLLQDSGCCSMAADAEGMFNHEAQVRKFKAVNRRDVPLFTVLRHHKVIEPLTRDCAWMVPSGQAVPHA